MCTAPFMLHSFLSYGKLGCKSFWGVGGLLVFLLFLARFCSICLEDILEYLFKEAVYWINGLFVSSSTGSFVFLFCFLINQDILLTLDIYDSLYSIV